MSLVFCQTVNKHLHFSHIEATLIIKGDRYCSMLCVQFLFWYMAHDWNYGILATPARTIVKTRLKQLHPVCVCSTVGVLSTVGGFLSTVGGFLSTVEGYLEYRGGIS